jgi:FkbM family methyltransferase
MGENILVDLRYPSRWTRWGRFFAYLMRRSPDRLTMGRVILGALLERVGLSRGPHELEVGLEGHRFVVDASRADIVAAPPIWYAHEYEPEPRFRPTLGGTVIDIGAHVGFFAVKAGVAVGPTGRVFAFEPDPASYGRLARNVALNGLGDRVEPIHAAMSDRDGTVDLAVDVHSTGTRIAPGEAPAGATRVASVTLDGFAGERKLGDIDLLKADAEGAEVSIFEHGRAVLGRTRAVAIEIHRQSDVPTLEARFSEAGLERVGHLPPHLYYYHRRAA